MAQSNRHRLDELAQNHSVHTSRQTHALSVLPLNSESYFRPQFQHQCSELYTLLSAHQIIYYCADLIKSASSVGKQAANETDVGEYEKNSQELLDRAKTLVVKWIESQESPDEVWKELLPRIDAKDSSQTHGM